MALYFAMIDGERRGPFTLDALHEAGVTPDTYVWSKGMSDWEQAADVADICRYYRQRIFDKLHPVPIVAEQPAVPEAEETREAGDGVGDPEGVGAAGKRQDGAVHCPSSIHAA